MRRASALTLASFLVLTGPPLAARAEPVVFPAPSPQEDGRALLLYSSLDVPLARDLIAALQSPQNFAQDRLAKPE